MGLYIIGNRSRKICKIGVSDNPEKRIKSIQTGCPYKVKLLSYFPDLSYESEKDMHKRYKGSRLYGEWFSINDEIEKILDDNPFTDKVRSVKPAKEIKEVPPISDIEQYRKARGKRKYKRNSKHIKNVFNPR